MGPRLDTGGWLTLTETIAGFLPTGTFTLQDTPSFARRDNVILVMQYCSNKKENATCDDSKDSFFHITPEFFLRI
jgi:hypothetical protein